MKNDLLNTIEDWFAEHENDGEFARPGQAVPYSVIVPASAEGRIVFTTKPNVLAAAVEACDTLVPFGMIGRCGLPQDADARWIRETLGPRGLVFLGDMDPVDLMVFVWLHEYLSSSHVSYLGISDTFLDLLGIEPSESVSIACAPSERDALALLKQIYPDLRETIGSMCSALLENGRKIECEATLGSKHRITEVLQSTVP